MITFHHSSATGISEPVFYGVIIHKVKKIVRKSLILVINLKEYYSNVIKSGIMRQSACLVINQISVYSHGFLFNCTTVGQDGPHVKLLFA